MALIYLDTSVLIYTTEHNGHDGNIVRQALADKSDDEFVISPLVVMECLVKPLRDHDFALQDQYERLFTRIQKVTLSDDTYLRAAHIRAHIGSATQDSLHIAAAQTNGCAQLWTTDYRLAAQHPDFVRNLLPANAP